MTANNLEAMAAPEMNTRATVRRNEAVFWTVDGTKLDGKEYASVILTKTDGWNFLQPVSSVFQPTTQSAEGGTEVWCGLATAC